MQFFRPSFYIAMLMCICWGMSFPVQAQSLRQLTLEDAISLARKQSPDAVLARNTYRASYWRYRYFRADYLPSLSMSSTLADLNRSFSRITLPDGSDSFIYRSVLNNDVSFVLNQKIGLTGGSVYLNSGLQRLQILNSAGQPSSYLATPVIIGLRQPVNGYNELRWQKRIEPLYYSEARKNYVQAVEDLSLQTVSNFFDVLLQQNNYFTALQNRANSDTLYKLAQGRYNLGRIAENDLLQLELNYLNSGLAVQQAAIAMGAANARLKTFLGLGVSDSLVLIAPVNTDTFQVSLASALAKAKEYSPVAQNNQRRQLEAARDVAQAKGQNGFLGDLFAEYGLNQSASVLATAYKNPADQEQFRFGIQVPLLNWGRSKGAIEMAKAQQELTKTVLQQQQTDFEQNVSLQAAEFNLQGSQLTIANKASEVGQRRYFIAKQRYLLGKIGITDLNIAQTERDAAQIAYLQVLRNFWQSYYRLRRTTLYDFRKDEPLEKALDKDLY